MSIIVEGPDNSGKTTLCQKLRDQLAMPIFHAGGPPATNDIALKLCHEQTEFLKHKVILDRITPISRQIYENRFNDPDLMDHLKNMLRVPFCVIIYCRPPNERLMDMASHEVKKHDTPEHLAYVLENHHNFIELYDRMMAGVPHLLYDWTDMQDNFEQFAKQVFKTQIREDYAKTISIGG